MDDIKPLSDVTRLSRITTGAADYLAPATALHGETFKTDPVINYMLNQLPHEMRQAYIPSWMGQLLHAGSLNGGIFDEIDGFASSALVIPPGRNIDNLSTYWQAGLHKMLLKLGFGGVKKMIWDFQHQANTTKKEVLRARGCTRFYYLFFISTRQDRRGQGLGALLIRRTQERANDERVPVWLEATTEGSMRLYKRMGFKLIREIVLGKGSANRDGDLEKGGSGVRIWAMIWEPYTHDEKVVVASN